MLTHLEKQILIRLCKPNKEIAKALGLDLFSIKNRIHNLITKLKAKNRTEAILIGLLEEDIYIHEVIL